MTNQPTALPPGPYRFEPGETADTYRIFAAGDSKPMAELIYIGGDEDFAATAKALAQLFGGSSTLLAVLNTLHEDCRMALAGEWDRSDSGFEAMMHLIDTAINETTGKEAA